MVQHIASAPSVKVSGISPKHISCSTLRFPLVSVEQLIQSQWMLYIQMRPDQLKLTLKRKFFVCCWYFRVALEIWQLTPSYYFIFKPRLSPFKERNHSLNWCLHTNTILLLQWNIYLKMCHTWPAGLLSWVCSLLVNSCIVLCFSCKHYNRNNQVPLDIFLMHENEKSNVSV